MLVRRAGPRLLIMIIAAALALRLYDLATSQPHNLPWTPLSLSDPLGSFTIRKLGQLRDDPARCLALLRDADVRYTRLPPFDGPGSCGYSDGVGMTNGTGIDYAPTMAGACPIAASLFMWHHQIVEPAAYRHFGQPVVQIDNFGTYACRTIGNVEGGAMSEHATANAIDIAGFRLRDGRRVSVAADWRDQEAAGAFLHDVRNGACKVFGTVLSPDYNAAHHDHLHFDQARRGGWSYCR